MKCASTLPEFPPLAQAKMDLDSEFDRLSSYIIKSARHRVKLVKSREIPNVRKAIVGELAFSGSARPDLVENLLDRLDRISQLTNQIELLEQKDYELRFGISKS